MPSVALEQGWSRDVLALQLYASADKAVTNLSRILLGPSADLEAFRHVFEMLAFGMKTRSTLISEST